tara:strand:+ start:126 stop:623 length:498 start_codon:yes stop_codon:yes gene_type:complete
MKKLTVISALIFIVIAIGCTKKSINEISVFVKNSSKTNQDVIIEMNYLNQANDIRKVVSYNGIPDAWIKFHKASIDIDSFKVTIRDINGSLLVDSLFRVSEIGDSINYAISFTYYVPTKRDLEAELKHNILANNPNRDFLEDSTKSMDYIRPIIFCRKTVNGTYE